MRRGHNVSRLATGTAPDSDCETVRLHGTACLNDLSTRLLVIPISGRDRNSHIAGSTTTKRHLHVNGYGEIRALRRLKVANESVPTTTAAISGGRK